jgi:hypothetical protein
MKMFRVILELCIAFRGTEGLFSVTSLSCREARAEGQEGGVSFQCP